VLKFNLKYIIISLRIELTVFLIMITSLLLFIGVCKTNISSDGVGYYDYLPSAFIHNDLYRNNTSISSRIDSMSVYVDINGVKVNKFNAGVAILQLPFFSIALAASKFFYDGIITGYEIIFQKSMFIGALFYYFISLVFLRKALQLYKISGISILVTLFLYGLATNAIQYINNEATFSHVYCMFLVTVFIYLIKKLQLGYRKLYIYFISIIIGLLLITRLVDALIILSVPFIVGNLNDLKQMIKNVFLHKTPIIISLIIFLLFVSIQPVLWYMQSGSILIDTYQYEKFNFFKPEFINFWFSYRKGLFLYTPITLISILLGITLLYKKEQYLALNFLLFFLIVSYALSCWWSWWYSCGYGQRAFISYYPVIFVFYALSLDCLNGLIKKIIIFISLLTIPINHIQARQYKNFILNWEDMNYIKYWNVFLSNSNRFIGFNNKLIMNEDYLKINKRIKINDRLVLPQTKVKIVETDLPLFEKGYVVKVTNYDYFGYNNRANLELCLQDNGGDTLYSKKITYTNLTNTLLGNQTQGTYYFKLPGNLNNSKLSLTIKTLQTAVRFKNAMFIIYEIR